MVEPIVVTDFSQYTLPQLSRMLYDSDPAVGTEAAQTWDSTARMLHEQALNLDERLRGFDAEWKGGAAAQYKQMINGLVQGIRKVADTAFQMRDLTYESVDALDRARAEMPAPVDVPAGPPTAASPQQQAAAVQTQQRAAAAASAAHAKAVAVMRTLAGSYMAARASYPASPDTPTGPTSGTSAPGSYVTPVDHAGGTGAIDRANPLFGNMFRMGLAAASAAAAGRFRGLMPTVPAFAKRKQGGASPTQAGAGPLGARVLADRAAAGSGAAPTASVGMVGTEAARVAGLSGGALLGGAAASAGGRGAMMPMMPMGGMAGAGMGDMGGNRRIPPWLVETEDIWGTSSPVAPGLIGDTSF